MIEHIYSVFGEILLIIMVAVVAHYVFLEPLWKKWQYGFNVVVLLLLICVEIFIEAEERIFICLFFAGVNISLAREKHRVRGFFLVFPIMGICIGIQMPLVALPELVFKIPAVVYDVMLDIVTLLCVLLFIWKGRAWRKKFELELQYRKLQKWESRLLIFIGLILILIMLPILDSDIVAKLGTEMKMYVLLCSISSLILIVTVIELVMQGNKRAYYESVAALNEGYLKAEIKHFQAYQKTQTETRRVRHDMKNHMQSLLYLAKEERYEELRKYLEDLSLSMEQIDMELHCGNSLADAICNEKNQLAVLKGISFEIEGRMPENTKIEPVDICTIFSNALDNAIEALENEAIQKRWIKLEISCQGEILFLRFTNPVLSTQIENFKGNTTKTDRINHGFGLQNIRLSAEKYHGEINTAISTENGSSIFALEIILQTG